MWAWYNMCELVSNKCMLADFNISLQKNDIVNRRRGFFWLYLTKNFYRYSTESSVNRWYTNLLIFWSGNWLILNFVMRWLLVVYVLHYRKNWILILLLLDKFEFKCKSRGMETCLHSRDAALNARETGIYHSREVKMIEVG